MEDERDITWEPKIAVLISSFARPTDLIRQAFSMGMNQTYKNVHLFISVKGVPESVYTTLILPQLTPLIQQGRATLHWDGNTNQAWNLLDTVRRENVEEYDLFCKVDDDDYYHPEYLSVCAEALKLAPSGASTYVSGNYPTVSPEGFTHKTGTLFPPGSTFVGWGDMLGMGREVIQHLLHVMDDDEALMQEMRLHHGGDYWDLGVQEDRYYFACMKEMTPCVEITPLFNRRGITPVVVGRHTVETSISRGIWVSRKEFFSSVRYVTKERKDKGREYILQDTADEVYTLFNGKITNLKTREERRYVEFTPGILMLEGGEMCEREKDGRYVKARRDSGGS